MTAPRRPAAFRIEPEAATRQEAANHRAQVEVAPARKPRTTKTDMAVVVPAEIDVFDEPDIIAAEPPPATAPRKRSLLASIFQPLHSFFIGQQAHSTTTRVTQIKHAYRGNSFYPHFSRRITKRVATTGADAQRTDPVGVDEWLPN